MKLREARPSPKSGKHGPEFGIGLVERALNVYEQA